MVIHKRLTFYTLLPMENLKNDTQKKLGVLVIILRRKVGILHF